MADYDVRFASSAAKEFRSLPTPIKHRIAAAVDSLSKEARPPGTRKLVGHERLYRIRVGSYRVIYEVDDEEHVVRVTRVRHRREVYR